MHRATFYRRELDMKWRLVIVILMILGCAGCGKADTVLTIDDIREADTILTIEDIREAWAHQKEIGVGSVGIEGQQYNLIGPVTSIGQKYSLSGVVTIISDIHPAYRVGFDGGYMDIHDASEIPERGTVIEEVVIIYDAWTTDGLLVLRGYVIAGE